MLMVKVRTVGVAAGLADVGSQPAGEGAGVGGRVVTMSAHSSQPPPSATTGTSGTRICEAMESLNIWKALSSWSWAGVGCDCSR